MAKVHKIRKPKAFKAGDVYAGFLTEGGVYIGGPYYTDSAQIHLSEEDTIYLSAWLNKVAEYLKQPRCLKLKGKR